MNNRKLKETAQRKYSSAKKRNIVEELRSGMLTIRQCTKQYQVSVSILQDWNRVLLGPSYNFEKKALGGFVSYIWVINRVHTQISVNSADITLLKYFKPKSSLRMEPSLDQLKQQLAAAQAQITQLQLQKTALETMISVAEKQLKIEIRKKPGSKQSRS